MWMNIAHVFEFEFMNCRVMGARIKENCHATLMRRWAEIGYDVTISVIFWSITKIIRVQIFVLLTEKGL